MNYLVLAWKLGSEQCKPKFTIACCVISILKYTVICLNVRPFVEMGSTKLFFTIVRADCEGWLCLHFCRWSLNGTLIDLDGDERRHVSGGNLIINTLDRDQDAGIYQCSASNARGIILSHRATVQFACEFSGSNSAILSSWLDSAYFWQVFG